VPRINEELDAASGSGLSSDEARPFEGQYHLVNRGWAHAEILLHVGFGRRPAVQARVEVNKGQILALLGREGFCASTHPGHPIQLFVHASNKEEARMNVRYRSAQAVTFIAVLTVALHQTSPTSSFDHILATLNEFAFDRGPMAGKISQLQGGMTCPASSFQSRTAD
jgi:hypothetical protein